MNCSRHGRSPPGPHGRLARRGRLRHRPRRGETLDYRARRPPREETSGGGTTGGEQTIPPGDRTTTKGLITEVDRTSTGKWILVEADPDADCRRIRSLRNNPGCDKMYYEVLGKPARVHSDDGCDGKGVEEASADDLEVGQRVRAWTGEPYATSNPGQARAWEVVICAGATENAAPSPTPGAEEEIVLLRQQGRPTRGSDVVPGAAFTGTLVVDKSGCLRLQPGDLRGHLPVWPPVYSLGTEGGETVVLGDRGRVVARVGGEIEVGGGEIRKGEAGGSYEEKRREFGVPERCQGPLWMVVPPVREIEPER
jgi:hypothetical protein